jgi:hypothetical protein
LCVVWLDDPAGAAKFLELISLNKFLSPAYSKRKASRIVSTTTKLGFLHLSSSRSKATTQIVILSVFLHDIHSIIMLNCFGHSHLLQLLSSTFFKQLLLFENQNSRLLTTTTENFLFLTHMY